MIPTPAAIRHRRSKLPSASEPFRELTEQALSRGRNAKAIWQDLVDGHSLTGGCQSVKRFITKLRGTPEKQPCAVIVTAPGEDYGERRVRVRCGETPHFSKQSPPRSV